MFIYVFINIHVCIKIEIVIPSLGVCFKGHVQNFLDDAVRKTMSYGQQAQSDPLYKWHMNWVHMFYAWKSSQVRGSETFLLYDFQ